MLYGVSVARLAGPTVLYLFTTLFLFRWLELHEWWVPHWRARQLTAAPALVLLAVLSTSCPTAPRSAYTQVYLHAVPPCCAAVATQAVRYSSTRPSVLPMTLT